MQVGVLRVSLVKLFFVESVLVYGPIMRIWHMTFSWKKNPAMTNLDRNNAHPLVHEDEDRNARCVTLD